MTNITVNATAHTIELSKKFAAAVAKDGSDEYNVLQEVRRDYPGYYKVSLPKANK